MTQRVGQRGGTLYNLSIYNSTCANDDIAKALDVLVARGRQRREGVVVVGQEVDLDLCVLYKINPFQNTREKNQSIAN
jgi:hypothetical protein